MRQQIYPTEALFLARYREELNDLLAGDAVQRLRDLLRNDEGFFGVTGVIEEDTRDLVNGWGDQQAESFIWAVKTHGEDVEGDKCAFLDALLCEGLLDSEMYQDWLEREGYAEDRRAAQFEGGRFISPEDGKPSWWLVRGFRTGYFVRADSSQTAYERVKLAMGLPPSTRVLWIGGTDSDVLYLGEVG